MIMKGIVHGVGVNDAWYSVKPIIDGIRHYCPYYVRWSSMISRCYSESYQNRYPTYRGCSVCDEWLKFSNFRSWMKTQEWEGKQLDKDIIVKGNKIYSPENCAFIMQETNKFILSRDEYRGDLPIGVCFDKKAKKYKAACGSFKRKNGGFAGNFDDPHEAHLAWLKKKREHAISLSEMESDERVKNALINMYL